MKTAVYLWTDRSTVLTDDIAILIQLYRSDLDDLKGETGKFILFSGGALIPLQIQNNVIHRFYALNIYFRSAAPFAKTHLTVLFPLFHIGLCSQLGAYPMTVITFSFMQA